MTTIEELSIDVISKYRQGIAATINHVIGTVDAIIATVRDNKVRYPIMDKFFSHEVSSGEYKGTYYGFVDYIQ